MTDSDVTPQWDGLLKHLGSWEGSFTRLSPTGAQQEDMPTLVRLEGLNNNQAIRQTNEYFSQENENSNITRVMEFNSLSRSVLFCEDGSFSQGSMQFSPVAEFGAEFGFVWGDRRMRLVVLFQPSDGENRLHQLTLIRECRQGSNASERPPLTLDALVGEWQGEAVTLYPDWRSPDRYATRLVIQQEGDRLHQRLTTPQFALSSSGRIEGDRLQFEEGNFPVQVLLLPDGASCHTPLVIPRRQSFLLEAGWLVEPGLRLRLIRGYDAQGGWSSLTLVTERKDQTSMKVFIF